MKFKVMLIPYLLNLSKLINKQNFEVIKIGNYAYCVKVLIIFVIKLTLISTRIPSKCIGNTTN